VKSIDALEAQFVAELRTALRRAAKGRCPTLFSLNDKRERSSARKLRAKAERILELRQSYSVDHSVVCPASRYLTACLSWQHGSALDCASTEELARNLLHELDINEAEIDA
jgi:hypothetical protein